MAQFSQTDQYVAISLSNLPVCINIIQADTYLAKSVELTLMLATSSDFCKHTLLTSQLHDEIELGVSFKKMYSFPMFVSRVSDNPSITKNANLLLT